jgi:hypothetical protein
MNVLRRRADFAWIALLFIIGGTVLTLEAGLGKPALNALIVAAMLAKARLVALDFLGLRSAPRAWRNAITYGVGFVALLAWTLATLS